MAVQPERRIDSLHRSDGTSQRFLDSQQSEHFLALRFSERSNSLMTAASTSAQICLS
jgi:hypothetical protein